MRQTYRRALLRNRAITNLPSGIPHWESAGGLSPNAVRISKKNPRTKRRTADKRAYVIKWKMLNESHRADMKS